MLSWHEAQSFDRLAEDYDRLGDLGNDPFGDWVPSVVPVSRGRALDLGCGAGRHAVLLADWFDQVDAVDLSGPMIRLARRKRPRSNVCYSRVRHSRRRRLLRLRRQHGHAPPRAGPARRPRPHQVPGESRRPRRTRRRRLPETGDPPLVAVRRPALSPHSQPRTARCRRCLGDLQAIHRRVARSSGQRPLPQPGRVRAGLRIGLPHCHLHAGRPRPRHALGPPGMTWARHPGTTRQGAMFWLRWNRLPGRTCA